MTDNPHQLVLDLPNRSAWGLEDFMVSTSNRDAVEIIDKWPDWPHQTIVLSGPEGAGKTHLANVWKTASGARMQNAEAISDQWISNHDGADPLVIEDFDRSRIDEQALFHLLNLAKERGFHMLFTARKPPGAWSIELPDLRSRIRALPLVSILQPDDILLQTLLIKLFDDRQLPISPAAIKYLARHMDRSTRMAVTLVDAVDRAAWESAGQRVKIISRDMAGDVLNGIMRDRDE